MIRSVLAAACMAGLMLPASAESYPNARRVLAIGGAVTEIVYALGEEGRLVARDSTSLYPEAANELPDVGYMRGLSPEGVLSVNPDLIIALEGAGPAESVNTLKSASIPYVEVGEDFTPQGIIERVQDVAAALGVPEKGEQLEAEIRAQLEGARQAIAAMPDKPRVMFVLSVEGGRALASGAGTAADGIISMAGAENVFSDFPGYKQVTDEAILTAAPDAILMISRGGDHDATLSQVMSIPALAATPAGREKALIKMDGLYLLGFGPRTAAASLDLAKALREGRHKGQ